MKDKAHELAQGSIFFYLLNLINLKHGRQVSITNDIHSFAVGVPQLPCKAEHPETVLNSESYSDS